MRCIGIKRTGALAAAALSLVVLTVLTVRNTEHTYHFSGNGLGASAHQAQHSLRGRSGSSWGDARRSMSQAFRRLADATGAGGASPRRPYFTDDEVSEFDTLVVQESGGEHHGHTWHKPLHPINGWDLAGVGLACVGLMIAAAGGIGGGGILVPLYILVLQFHPKHAIPLSNITIFGGAITNTVLNLSKRHPDADRPLVDWDLILVMEPLTIGGALVGSFINKVQYLTGRAVLKSAEKQDALWTAPYVMLTWGTGRLPAEKRCCRIVYCCIIVIDIVCLLCAGAAFGMVCRCFVPVCCLPRRVYRGRRIT